MGFVASDMQWSPDGKYLSVSSRENRQFRVFQVDKVSQENIWTLIDYMHHNKNFWKQYPISLRKNTITEEIEKHEQLQQRQAVQQSQADSGSTLLH